MSDQPKARFTMPPGARDVTAAALGTLFALIGAGRARSGAASRPGENAKGAPPMRSDGEGQLAEQQTHQRPRQPRRRPF